jgi:hypothetical protein
VPSKRQVERYLSTVSKKKVRVVSFEPLVSEKGKAGGIKTLGYGVPYLAVYREGTRAKRSIISTMRISGGFGHDFRADRVDNMVLAYDTWKYLPKHSTVQDLGAFVKGDSSLLSLGGVDEFFILRPMIEGTEYFKDLDRIFSSGQLLEHDIPRAEALSEYLVEIHSKKNKKKAEAGLYARKIRDTVGHGECIFGLSDSYPKEADFLKEGELESLEKKSVEYRWKLNSRSHRLAQVHGDFHPWNVLFSLNPRTPTSFRLLDRSRGMWGEPADDVCAMSINYIFYSLRKYGELKGEFRALYENFMNLYLEKTRDEEILETLPLFYTFRALVIASPLWYPSLSVETRRRIFDFAHNILDSGKFDPGKVNDYLRAT